MAVEITKAAVWEVLAEPLQISKAVMKMITFRDVSKIYHIGGEEVRALDHASMQIDQGEFVGIIGPSGSGKSTLMNIMGCLDVADEGEYILDGQPIEHYSERELAKIRNHKLGFIFQNFN